MLTGQAKKDYQKRWIAEKRAEVSRKALQNEPGLSNSVEPDTNIPVVEPSNVEPSIVEPVEPVEPQGFRRVTGELTRERQTSQRGFNDT
jgi:hypothetical protein